jgi:peptidoglycan/LPS O-acetylase OafA/YrhL
METVFYVIYMMPLSIKLLMGLIIYGVVYGVVYVLTCKVPERFQVVAKEVFILLSCTSISVLASVLAIFLLQDSIATNEFKEAAPCIAFFGFIAIVMAIPLLEDIFKLVNKIKKIKKEVR